MKKTLLASFTMLGVGLIIGVFLSPENKQQIKNSIQQPKKQAHAESVLLVPGVVTNPADIIAGCNMEGFKVQRDELEIGYRKISFAHPDTNTEIHLQVHAADYDYYNQAFMVNPRDVIEATPTSPREVVEYWGSVQNLNYDWAELGYIYPVNKVFGEPINGIRCAYKNISVFVSSETLTPLVSKIAEWVILKARNEPLVDVDTLNSQYKPHFVEKSIDREVLYDDERAIVSATLVDPGNSNLTWEFSSSTAFKEIDHQSWYYRGTISNDPSHYGPNKRCYIKIKSDRLLGDIAKFTFEYRKRN